MLLRIRSSVSWAAAQVGQTNVDRARPATVATEDCACWNKLLRRLAEPAPVASVFPASPWSDRRAAMVSELDLLPVALPFPAGGFGVNAPISNA
jgi:hypothetical protein